MTIVSDAAVEMIEQFGEVVTVIPQSSQEPTSSSDPIYFEETESSEPSFDLRIRLYTSPSEDTLKEYGFSEDATGMAYSTEDKIKEGDRVKYDAGGYEWVVANRSTNQLGNGPYIYIYELKGV